MLSRSSLALGLVGLIAPCFLSSTACSSKQRRDQYYGTDEGRDYRPEAGVFSASSVNNDASVALDAPSNANLPDANRTVASPDSDDADASSSSDRADSTLHMDAADADSAADDADIDS